MLMLTDTVVGGGGGLGDGCGCGLGGPGDGEGGQDTALQLAVGGRHITPEMRGPCGSPSQVMSACAQQLMLCVVLLLKVNAMHFGLDWQKLQHSPTDCTVLCAI
jgi:hypothetical protein